MMDERERVHCAMMMLVEISKLEKAAGDTRAYLSVDGGDLLVLREALQRLISLIGYD